MLKSFRRQPENSHAGASDFIDVKKYSSQPAAG